MIHSSILKSINLNLLISQVWNTVFGIRIGSVVRVAAVLEDVLDVLEGLLADAVAGLGHDAL